MNTLAARPFLLVAWLLVLIPLGVAGAATGSDITIAINCEGFTTLSGSINFENDTTVEVRAFDGIGGLIYESTISGSTGSTYTFNGGERFAWSTAPRFSPIVLAMTTDGETVLDEDVVYLVVGNCPGLPRLSNAFAIGAQLDLLPLLVAVDGGVSPSVPLNAVPPRPSNPADEVEVLPGYAVVDTDNLFMRSGPGVEFTPVAIVDGGTRLIVLGRNESGLSDDSDDLWWYVEAGGLRGWVNSAFLVLRGDLSSVDVVPSQGEIIPPSVYVGFTGTPLLASPEVGSSFVCTLVGNLFYPVTGRDSVAENFYFVEATCQDGRTAQGWLPLESVILRNEASVDIPVVP